MADVPIEILKERLSEYLERAREGEQIFITEHGRSIALLAPVEENKAIQRAWELVRTGVAHWAGGKPEISRDKPTLRGGRSASDAILEDRR